jgi:hypothetical protein
MKAKSVVFGITRCMLKTKLKEVDEMVMGLAGDIVAI